MLSQAGQEGGKKKQIKDKCPNQKATRGVKIQVRPKRGAMEVGDAKKVTIKRF